MRYILVFIIILGLFSLYRELTTSNLSIHNPSPTPVIVTPEPSYISEDELFQVVNIYRDSKGLKKLIKSESLCKIAKERSLEIETDWSHEGFQRRSTANDEQSLTKSSGFNYLGENLVRDTYYAESALTGWIGSELHKKNMDDRFTHSCVKCNKNFCAQVFGAL